MRSGHLYVSAFPWGTVYLDGRRIGNTPLVGIEVAPGRYVLRIEREGFERFEAEIEVTPGAEWRRTDIVLKQGTGS